MKKVTVDGNYAASNIAYMMNEVAMIYPITPSSPMAENCDQFVFENKKSGLYFYKPLFLDKVF